MCNASPRSPFGGSGNPGSSGAQDRNVDNGERREATKGYYTTVAGAPALPNIDGRSWVKLVKMAIPSGEPAGSTGLTPATDKIPLDEGIKKELPDQRIRCGTIRIRQSKFSNTAEMSGDPGQALDTNRVVSRVRGRTGAGYDPASGGWVPSSAAERPR